MAPVTSVEPLGARPLLAESPPNVAPVGAPAPVEVSRRPLGTAPQKTSEAAAPSSDSSTTKAPPDNAVRAPAKAPATQSEKPKCSVDQILKMKELKFTDAQIKGACGD